MLPCLAHATFSLTACHPRFSLEHAARNVTPAPCQLTHAHSVPSRSYLERLATFTVSLWFAKPAALSPLECARHGWRCSAADRLECPLCAARIMCVVKPGDDSLDLTRITPRTLYPRHPLPSTYATRIQPCGSVSVSSVWLFVVALACSPKICARKRTHPARAKNSLLG
jgi:hypothetical protein